MVSIFMYFHNLYACVFWIIEYTWSLRTHLFTNKTIIYIV